jgi:hypothetical protein
MSPPTATFQFLFDKAATFYNFVNAMADRIYGPEASIVSSFLRSERSSPFMGILWPSSVTQLQATTDVMYIFYSQYTNPAAAF